MKIVIAFLVALLVFLFLKALRLGLRRLARLYPGWNFKINFLSALELAVAVLYVFWVTAYLLQEKFYYEYLVYTLIIIIAGLLAWFLIRDIVAGYIFKVKQDVKTGSRIMVGDLSGVVKSLHLTCLKIKTDDGQVLRVPFSRVINEVISEVTHTETLEEHAIHVHVDPALSKPEAEELIRTAILNSPWSNLKEDPAIRLLDKNEEGSHYEILLLSMDRKHIKFIEMALEDLPQVKVLS